MVSFIKPSAAANMKQYLMPSYGEIMKHALTCKAIGAEVCSSVWCEFVLVKVNMNQLGVILYLNMYVCKFEPIQHVFRQKAFCKESILFHSYTLFYSLQRGQGIFIAINYTHVFSGDPIILTNYESLRISQLNFCAVEFDVVALDEAQKIKSPGTLVTNAAKALKCNFKIAMTGTPVENSLLDLWCIMDFCVPGLLGNAKAFAAQYQNPLKKEDNDIVALGNEVHDKLGVYFMRRLKKDAAKDLPDKIELKEKVLMPPVQKEAYASVVNDYTSGIQPNMLVTIMHLREVSEHPYLYDSTLLNHETDEIVETSARLQATIKFLDEIKKKEEKVIIFVERKETQKCFRNFALKDMALLLKSLMVIHHLLLRGICQTSSQGNQV